MAAGAHAPALTTALWSLFLWGASTVAVAQEPPNARLEVAPAAVTMEPQSPVLAPTPIQRSRLGAWQLHLQVLLGLEPVDSVRAVAFGGNAELLWKCRVGVFAGFLSSKGNADRPASSNGEVLQAPADRISVPFGIVFRPFGNRALRAGGGLRGWADRLAAGVGIEVGPSIEHLRDSGSGRTVGAFHAALALDIPLYGGPVEGGVLLRLMGRLIAEPSVSLEDPAVIHMPSVSGQFYGGLAWAL